MLVLVVRGADEERDHSALKLLGDVGQRLSEWATSIYRALTEELDTVAFLIGSLLPEGLHLAAFVSLGNLRADLPKHRVLAFMVNLATVSKVLCLAAAHRDIVCTIVRIYLVNQSLDELAEYRRRN